MESFENLGICWSILEAIKKKGYVSPTEIQKKVIPLSLENKNIIAASPTGSGKTMAFAVCAIQKTYQDKGLQTLILVPTKELANQIYEEISFFSALRNIYINKISGGQPATLKKYDDILKSNILISTPKILLEYVDKFNLSLNGIKTLILDEADSLICSDFEDDIVKILEKIPRTRQTLMFSATMTLDIAKRANKYMRSPIKVYAGNRIEPKKLKQFFYKVDSKKKFSLLLHLIKTEKSGLSIIFTNRTDTAIFLQKNLKSIDGMETGLITGDMSNNKRKSVIDDFLNNKLDILVSTDVIARGIDFENVTHIYNYNMPNDDLKYIHRIGRTARAGNSGKVINLVSDKDVEKLVNVINKQKISMAQKSLPEFEVNDAVQIKINKDKYKKHSKKL